MDELGDMLTREVDFTNKSMDFKVGYGYGVRDGRNEEWERWRKALNKEETARNDYPQAHEKNEYRYLSPAWLDEIAKGLTAGQEKYPGETWRKIPAKEHAWRAVRHLMLYLKGDKADTHLINASMRCMMCFETDAAANDVIEWEKLMREKGCG